MARTRRKSAAGPVLYQVELARLRQAQARVAALQADLADARKDCVRQDALARAILSLPNVRIEPGPLTAAVDVSYRKNIPWKAVCVERLGLATVEKISTDWPADESTHVVVSEIGAQAAVAEVA